MKLIDDYEQLQIYYGLYCSVGADFGAPLVHSDIGRLPRME